MTDAVRTALELAEKALAGILDDDAPHTSLQKQRDRWEGRMAEATAALALVRAEIAATEHDWFEYRGMTCCRKCGRVRRADGRNKPCPGVVRVGPREHAALATPAKVGEDERAKLIADLDWAMRNVLSHDDPLDPDDIAATISVAKRQIEADGRRLAELKAFAPGADDNDSDDEKDAWA